jgi:spore coat polysaccharide biosynthesis predicted glycosyltransferase SpsG
LPRLARIAATAFPLAHVTVVGRDGPTSVAWPDRCDVRQAPADYPDLVRHADVIICGGGQSLIEAAAVGTPAAALLLGDDQFRQRAAMIAAGAAADGGDWRTTNADAELQGALESLRDAGSRTRMSSRGRALVDGRGADRLAAEILDAWQAR